MSDPLDALRLSDEDKYANPPNRRRWIWLSIALLILAVPGIFFLLNRFQASAPVTERPSRTTADNISAANATPVPAPTVAKDSAPIIMAGGFIEARRSAKVYPGRNGIVAGVHVTEGQFVHKGELLVTLDTCLVAAEVAIARAELQKAEANLALMQAGFRKEDILDMQQQVAAAKAQWDREKDLLARSEQLLATAAVSQREVIESRFKVTEHYARLQALKARLSKHMRGYRREDIAAAQAEQAKARASLQYAREKLALSYLKAPFDGVVTEVELEPGEALSTMSGSDGGLGIKMADVTRLYVKLDIPETKIATIVTGTPAEIFVDALGTTALKGTVTGIAPVADRQSNTIEIAVQIDTPPPLLRPNMSARVRITTQKK
jgi:multidrug resistance efflux pump